MSECKPLPPSLFVVTLDSNCTCLALFTSRRCARHEVRSRLVNALVRTVGHLLRVGDRRRRAICCRLAQVCVADILTATDGQLSRGRRPTALQAGSGKTPKAKLCRSSAETSHNTHASHAPPPPSRGSDGDMEDECEMHARELYRGTEWADSDDDDDDKSEDYQRGIPGDILYIIFPHGDVDAAGWGGPAPEEATRGEFLARAPAMGLSAFDIARLQEFARGDGDGDGDGDGVALPRDTRRIFRLLRRRLLRQCVPCDGASTLTALADALDAERAAGVASPMPTW